MKIAVLNVSRHKNCTLKDVAGGFGTVFTVGNSPFAKLLELAKRRIAAIPNITLAYLDSILSAHGASVRFWMSADPINWSPPIFISSLLLLSTARLEREIGLEARRRFGAKVGYFGPFAATVPDFYQEVGGFRGEGGNRKYRSGAGPRRNPARDCICRIRRESRFSAFSTMGSIRDRQISLPDCHRKGNHAPYAGQPRLPIHMQLLPIPGELEIQGAKSGKHRRRNPIPGEQIQHPRYRVPGPQSDI